MPPLTITPVLVSPRGVGRPVNATYNCYASFKVVQEAYYQQIGKTFKLAQPRSFMYPFTWPECIQMWSGKGQDFWKDMADRAGLNMCADQAQGKAYYFVFLHPYAAQFDMAGLGGMIGLERWDCPARPGTAMVADHMAWLLCGLRKADLLAQGWSIPWFAEEWWSAYTALAHEIGHLSRAALAHPADWSVPPPPTDPAWNSPMWAWWDGAKLQGKSVFTDSEKATLLASGDFA